MKDGFKSTPDTKKAEVNTFSRELCRNLKKSESSPEADLIKWATLVGRILILSFEFLTPIIWLTNGSIELVSSFLDSLRCNSLQAL